MAGRIRSVKPEVLEDEIAAALSDSAWRLWVSTWVLADDHGNLRLGNRYIASNVWQDTTRDPTAAIDELATNGFLECYAVNGQRYGHIRGFAKHQRVDNAGKPRVPGPEQDDGTWEQALSGRFAAESAKPTPSAENNNSRRSRAPRARIPAAGSPTSDHRSPTPNNDLAETPVGVVSSDLEISQAANDPPHIEERPSEIRPIAVATIRSQGSIFVDTYVATIRATTGHATWSMGSKSRLTLERVIANHCVGDDRANLEKWLRTTVAAFVAAQPDHWSGHSAEGFEQWLNRNRPVADKTSAPEKLRTRLAPPVGGPRPDVTDPPKAPPGPTSAESDPSTAEPTDAELDAAIAGFESERVSRA